MNLLALPALLLGLGLFPLGKRLQASEKSLAWGLFAAGCALPALAFACYYTGLLGEPAWLYRFRSLPGSELSAGGCGLLGGWMAGYFKASRVLTTPVLLLLMSLGILGPHLKPLVAPLDEARLEDRWIGDLCMQSTRSTCGPACTATLLRHFGIEATEREIARACYSYRGGTENWYLARALRARGLQVSYRIRREGEAYPLPSIAGVQLPGAIGHFITLLEKTPEGYTVGDPWAGLQIIPEAQMQKRYRFTGFHMTVSRGGE